MRKKILDKKQIEDFFNDPYNEEVIELISQTIASYIVSAITANLSPDLIKKALIDIIKTVSPEPTSETKEQNIDIKNKTKDWSKHSDATLRRDRNRRKQKGKPIEDSLNEELAKRFPNYNAEKRTFGKNARRRRNTDWSKSSDVNIRNVYHYRIKKGLPIEDSLNEELAKRFPGYSAETRTFGKHAKRKNTNWSKSSANSIKTAYYRRKRESLPIEDSLNEELAKRFDNYDKEQKAFTPRQKSKKDWCKYSDMGLRNIYNKQKKEGLEIEDSLNEELAKRFKKYDSETRTFVKQKDLAQKAKDNIDNHDSKNATVIIPSAHTVEALPKTEKEQYQKIIVEIKPIKMTLEGTYNDVFVNGRKLLKNHINTEVQLFCEDTILGIHGIISGNKYYPEAPIWLIYDTNIQQRPPEQKNIITKYNILVKKVYNYPKEIRLELDNRAIVILKNEKMKKIAELRRFVLDKQK